MAGLPADARATEVGAEASLAVIVAVRNEVGNIIPFYERSKKVLESLPSARWQIIFVNDCSDDGSLETICRLRNGDDRVKVISLSRSFGYHAVLVAGLSLVEADLYAIVDVDGEDPPELLADFYDAIAKGADIAYGIRSKRMEAAAITLFRRIFYYVNKTIADSDIVVWMGEFAMITKQVRSAILVPHTTYPFLRAELGYVGFERVGVPYVRGERISGRTHYNMYRMAKFAISGFLASSTFPLRVVLYLAVFIGLLFPAGVMLMGAGPELATSLAAITILYYLLIAVPTIAVYLARTYKNGVGRPVFVVDKKKTFL